MVGQQARNAANFGAYQLLTSVPREELDRFRVEGLHGGQVKRTNDTSKPARNVVGVRLTGWKLESRWKPATHRKQIKVKLRKLLQWKRRWRQWSVKKADLKSECGDVKEEEGIPEVSSGSSCTAQNDRGDHIRIPTVPPSVRIPHAAGANTDDKPCNEIDEARDSFSNDPFPRNHCPFPRQFSVDFSERQDENSLRKLPRIKKSSGARVRNLPRGVPFRPVNRHKDEKDASSQAIERLTMSSKASSECSGRSSSECSRKTSSKMSADNFSGLLPSPGALDHIMREKTSPVSSARSSGTCNNFRGSAMIPKAIARIDSEDSSCGSSTLSSTGICKASEALVSSARKRACNEPSRFNEDDKLTAAVSMFDDDFISFSCDSRSSRGFFKWRLKDRGPYDSRRGNKNRTKSKDSNFIRRLLVKGDT